MEIQYIHLLKPIRIGNVFFRNRIFTAPHALQAIQADEQYPTDAAITHLANLAKGGAACVTCAGASIVPVPRNNGMMVWDITRERFNHQLSVRAFRPDSFFMRQGVHGARNLRRGE